MDGSTHDDVKRLTHVANVSALIILDLHISSENAHHAPLVPHLALIYPLLLRHDIASPIPDCARASRPCIISTACSNFDAAHLSQESHRAQIADAGRIWVGRD